MKKSTHGKDWKEPLEQFFKDNDITYEFDAFVGNDIYGHPCKFSFKLPNLQTFVHVLWQNDSGSAQEKMAYKILMLAAKRKQYNYRNALLLIGGDGYDKNIYDSALGQVTQKYIADGHLVEVVDMTTFKERIGAMKVPA